MPCQENVESVCELTVTGLALFHAEHDVLETVDNSWHVMILSCSIYLSGRR